MLTYGADIAALARRAAGYVDRIFKGAVGVAVPSSLLLRADEVVR